jgi:hypothetical protein
LEGEAKSLTVTHYSNGTAELDRAGVKINLDDAQVSVFSREMAYIRMVPSGVTRAGAAFVVGSRRAIPFAGGPNDDGQPPLGMAERTGHDTFELHLTPGLGATPDEIMKTPAISITARDATRIETALVERQREAAAAAQAAKEAAIAENIRTGQIDPSAAARRSGGQPPAPHDVQSHTMPATLTSVELSLAHGQRLTMCRQAGDEHLHVSQDGRSFALTLDELARLESAVSIAKDDGENHAVVSDQDGFAFARIASADHGRYDVQIDNREAFSLSPKDGAHVVEAATRLSSATRVDTGNGVVDLFISDNDTFVLRLPASDSPTEAELDPRSYAKLSRAVDILMDGFDENDPNGPDSGVTRVDVATNLGPVRVELFGEWGGNDPGARLEIESRDRGWAVTVAGRRHTAWSTATSKIEEIGEALEIYDASWR